MGEAAAALAKHNLRASEENGFLVSKDYSARKVSQIITDTQFSAPLKGAHPAVSRAQLSTAMFVINERDL